MNKFVDYCLRLLAAALVGVSVSLENYGAAAFVGVLFVMVAIGRLED